MTVNVRRFALVDLSLTTLAAALWYGAPDRASWHPLPIALTPWVLRVALRRKPPFHRTLLDIPLFLFLVTAGVGVWASYDQTEALKKFWMILSSIFLFYSLAGQSRRNAWLLCGGAGILGGLAGLYFLLSNDWKLIPADFDFIQRIGLSWMDVRPSFSFAKIDKNTIGGVIAVHLPFLIAFGLYCRRRRYQGLFLLTLLTGLIASLSLLLTSSRGAWISLGFSLTLWLLWWPSRRFSNLISIPREKAYLLFLAAALGIGLIITFSIFGGPGSLLRLLPGPDSATSRLELSADTIQLCRDYPLTGGGLMSFAGLYSTYLRITPFFLFSHSHNLFLDVLLEQGIGGLFSLFMIIVGSLLLILRPGASEREKLISTRILLFRWAAFASLVTLVLHGLMDDALYGALGTPLLFLVPGIAVAFSSKDGVSQSQLRPNRYRSILLFVLAVGATLLLVAASGSTLLGSWYANLGAVRMSKVELVDWPTNRWFEGDDREELRGALRLFQLALNKERKNFTAHYRLGLLAMRRRDFSGASEHLEAAYDQAPDHRGVVKSLGYCYVWMARFEAAAFLLSRIPEARQEMDAYSHWWRQQERNDLASNARTMSTRLIDHPKSAGNP